MKTSIAAIIILVSSSLAGGAQQPKLDATTVNQVPPQLEAPFAILKRSYPKVDAKKAPKPPADSVWLFRASIGSSGTAEVAFQGAEVVYMIFRRGTGGTPWEPAEIAALRRVYSKDLLKEGSVGLRYNQAVAPKINAATITRKDFDANSLFSSF